MIEKQPTEELLKALLGDRTDKEAKFIWQLFHEGKLRDIALDGGIITMQATVPISNNGRKLGTVWGIADD